MAPFYEETNTQTTIGRRVPRTFRGIPQTGIHNRSIVSIAVGISEEKEISRQRIESLARRPPEWASLTFASLLRGILRSLKCLKQWPDREATKTERRWSYVSLQGFLMRFWLVKHIYIRTQVEYSQDLENERSIYASTQF